MARKPKDPNSPWLKRVLIPFWVVQSLLDIFLFAGAIIDLVDGDFVAYVLPFQTHSLLLTRGR